MKKIIFALAVSFSILSFTHSTKVWATEPDIICSGGDNCAGYSTGEQVLDAITVIAKTNNSSNFGVLYDFANMQGEPVTYTDLNIAKNGMVTGTMATKTQILKATASSLTAGEIAILDKETGYQLVAYAQKPNTSSSGKPCAGCQVK